MKRKITVYQYNDIGQLSPKPYTKQKNIKKYEIEAWCVGGIEGILAFFFYGKYFYIAAGDDGHWWIIYHCHKDWFKNIKKTFKRMVING